MCKSQSESGQLPARRIGQSGGQWKGSHLIAEKFQSGSSCLTELCDVVPTPLPKQRALDAGLALRRR